MSILGNEWKENKTDKFEFSNEEVLILGIYLGCRIKVMIKLEWILTKFFRFQQNKNDSKEIVTQEHTRSIQSIGIVENNQV